LESLKKRGLAGTSPDKPVTQYFASSPDSLLHSANTRVKHEADVKNNLEQILPELKALHKDTRHRPKVRVYEGLEGIREVYWDMFNTKDVKDLKTYANPADLFKYVPDFVKHDKERYKRGIRMYAINPATKEVLELVKKYKLPVPDEALSIPKEKYKFSSDMGIYGDKVALGSPTEGFGVIIESKQISEMLRNSFDLAWKEAKGLDKEIKKKYFKR